MKKFVYLLATQLAALAGFTQAPQSWYKIYTGKVGEIKATVQLTMAGGRPGGYIWFDRTPRPMPIYADGSAGDSLILSANASPISLTLAGVLGTDGFTGNATLEKDGSPAKKSTFNLAPATDSVFTAFDYVYADGKASMPAASQNQSTAEYFAATIWPRPAKNKLLENSLKRWINKELGNKTAALKEPGKIYVAEKNRFLAGWKADMAKISPKEAKEMGFSNSQQTEDKIEVMYEDGKVLTLAHYNFAYTGGAHGNYITSVTNFNKQTGKQLLLKDVLTPEGIKAMPKLLELVIRQQYGFDKNKTLEQNGLFVKTVQPSENFYITNGNIGFLYSTYSIMAYAAGEPNIYLPYALVEKYLKPDFKAKP